MSRLKPLPNSELSGYAIQLLHRQQIYTVREFLLQSSDKLASYLNLNIAQVEIIREKIYSLYGPIQMTLYDVVQQQEYWLRASPPLGCGVKAIDQMLQSESLHAGSILEICGCSGVGKTQLCLTIALNYLQKQQQHLQYGSPYSGVQSSEVKPTDYLPPMKQVLYIDTKLDCNAHRIVSMLETRLPRVPKHIHGHLLQNIKIEHCFTLESIKRTLEKLLETFTTSNEDYYQSTKNIALIIIDAISAVWFEYRSDIHDHVYVSHWLLLRINNLVHQLAQQHGLAIILVNLALPINPRFRAQFNVSQSKTMTTMRFEHDDTDLNDSCSQRSRLSSGHRLRPCLGRYWSSAPNIRLSLNYLESGNDQLSQQKSSPLRNVILLKSHAMACGAQCQVQLTAEGVI